MEKPYETYERITGKKWTGGNSPDVQSAYSKYGITAPAGSADANLALQKALNGQSTAVDPIQKQVGYASSMAKAGEFTSNSSTLDSKLNTANGMSGGSVTDSAINNTGTGVSKTPVSPLPTPTPTPNPKEPKAPEYIDIGKLLDDEKAKLDPEYEKKKQENEKLYQTQFANYDQAYSNDVANINSIFNQRIETQKRLDKIDIDRRKAYGLGASGNAQYMPVEYSDAITNRERESANEIQKLDLERSNLLSKAKQARDSGQANLLKDNMERINAIEDRMRNQIKESLAMAQLENKTAWDNYEKQKEEFTKEMGERAKRAILAYGDEYNKAKTPEERQAIIKKAIESQGGTASDANIFVNMDSAFKANAEAVYKTELGKTKDTLALEKERQAIESTKATTAKKIADIAKGGAGKKLTVTEQNKQRDNAIANSVLTLSEAVKKNNWKGVDPTQYDTIVKLIKEEHGADAVLTFEKEFKAKKLKVDNGTK